MEASGVAQFPGGPEDRRLRLVLIGESMHVSRRPVELAALIGQMEYAKAIVR